MNERTRLTIYDDTLDNTKPFHECSMIVIDADNVLLLEFYIPQRIFPGISL